MGNQQVSSEQEKLQRLFLREVKPRARKKWVASNKVDGDIVSARMKVRG